MIQNLIRPGNVPFRLGLREPASHTDESPGDCHDVIEMSVSKMIHHDENIFQYSLQVTIRFYAVDTTGKCLPLTTSLNSSKSSQLLSNASSHQTNADLCVDYTELISSNTLLLFELTGSTIPSVGADATCDGKAWAFFRPKRLLADFLSPHQININASNGIKNFDTELQLYKWQKESLLVRKQAEQHILRKSAAGHLPEAFIQYLMQRRKKHNSCMCLKVKSIPIANTEMDVEEGKDQWSK